MALTTVLYEVSEAIAWVTLNRPDKLNALDAALHTELVAALRAADADAGVRAVVLTGAGRGFSAGGDIAYMQALMARGDEVEFRSLVAAGADIVRLIASSAKPFIAAVNGVAAGGGCNLALACDLRLAASTASFSQAFVKIGMHPDYGGTWLLPRLLGHARALELALTGRSVGAEEALALGLVSRVVAPEALVSETRALAASLAAGPPLAIARIKRNFWAAAAPGLDETLDRELATQLELFRSRDAREGMAAYREKRKASYSGS